MFGGVSVALVLFIKDKIPKFPSCGQNFNATIALLIVNMLYKIVGSCHQVERYIGKIYNHHFGNINSVKPQILFFCGRFNFRQSVENATIPHAQ